MLPLAVGIHIRVIIVIIVIYDCDFSVLFSMQHYFNFQSESDKSISFNCTVIFYPIVHLDAYLPTVVVFRMYYWFELFNA